jgi:hypothetical protein
MKQIASVDNQGRLYVSETLVAEFGITLGRGETTYVWAIQGPCGQVQLLPTGSSLSVARESMNNLLPSKIEWTAAGDDDVDTYRDIESMFRVCCHTPPRGAQIAITIPAEGLSVGTIRRQHEAVVFAVGGVLEIWDAQEWGKNRRAVDLRALERRVDALVELWNRTSASSSKAGP